MEIEERLHKLEKGLLNLDGLIDAFHVFKNMLLSHIEREETLLEDQTKTLEGQATSISYRLRELALLDHGDLCQSMKDVQVTLNEVTTRQLKIIRQIRWVFVSTLTVCVVSVVTHILTELLGH